MRLYPDQPRRRRAVMAGDLATLLLVAAFAWLANAVHDSVADLASLGRGVQTAGRSVGATARDAAGAVRGGLGAAADRVDAAPLVGGQLGDALRGAGDAAAGPIEARGAASERRLVAAGREGEREALQTARLLGWAAFLVPTLLLLSRVLPGRIALVLELTAAQKALRGAPEQILAQRAAFSLPLRTLTRHTPDPFGDLAAGRHARLLAALTADAGIRAHGRSQ